MLQCKKKFNSKFIRWNFAEIVFSVDATDKETYEKIRINGKYENI